MMAVKAVIDACAPGAPQHRSRRWRVPAAPPQRRQQPAVAASNMRAAGVLARVQRCWWVARSSTGQAQKTICRQFASGMSKQMQTPPLNSSLNARLTCGSQAAKYLDELRLGSRLCVEGRLRVEGRHSEGRLCLGKRLKVEGRHVGHILRVAGSLHYIRAAAGAHTCKAYDKTSRKLQGPDREAHLRRHAVGGNVGWSREHCNGVARTLQSRHRA